jgi:hypothetical protein
MRIRLVVVLAIVLGACAPGVSDQSAATTSPVAETTTSPVSTSPEATTTTPATGGEDTPTTRPAPNPDRPLAPEFSLTLSDGTEYEFASEVRPVYLVFWAEW